MPVDLRWPIGIHRATRLARTSCGNYAGVMRELCGIAELHFLKKSMSCPIGIQTDPPEFWRSLQQLYRSLKAYYRFNAELAGVYGTNGFQEESIGIHRNQTGTKSESIEIAKELKGIRKDPQEAIGLLNDL